jgi:hypothetical protein
MNPRRESSSSPQEGSALCSRERPEFVHEADLREELRVTCSSLLEPGHADEHHAETALVEHRTELFEARHGVPVGFINDDEQSGIGSLLRFVLFEGLEVSGGVAFAETLSEDIHWDQHIVDRKHSSHL